MPYEVKSQELAEFQRRLIGTWENDPALLEGEKPLSFNVMPLPQITPQPGRAKQEGATEYGGFILKNFSFTEKLRFNGTAGKEDPADQQDPGALAVVAGAPNRGGTYTQFAHAVFYEQQVRFAEGPTQARSSTSRTVPGCSLAASTRTSAPTTRRPKSSRSAFAPATVRDDRQADRRSAWQLRAGTGKRRPQRSRPVRPRQDRAESEDGIPGRACDPGPVRPLSAAGRLARSDGLPETDDVATEPFYDPYRATLEADNDFENPNVAWTLNPNHPLQRALEIIEPKAHMHWRVTTLPLFGGDSVVTNIPFEERKSKVTDYWADYWLLSQDPNAEETGKFDYLLYNQTVLMEMEVSTDGGETYQRYVFPHITSNVVKKVAGTPTEARKETETQLG